MSSVSVVYDQQPSDIMPPGAPFLSALMHSFTAASHSRSQFDIDQIDDLDYHLKEEFIEAWHSISFEPLTMPSETSTETQPFRNTTFDYTSLDFEGFGHALRLYAESQGEDYDALLAAAFKVIQQGQLQPRITPLTKEEIQDLIEDDLRAIPLEP